MIVQIAVSRDKCPAPRECRRCLESCPEAVFMTYPRVPRRPGWKAKDWVIVPVHLTLCTGCGVCVESCPQGAITMTTEAE